MSTRDLKDSPKTLPLYLKAALPVLPGISRIPGIRKSGDGLPDLTLTRSGVAIDRGHVAAYSDVCGFGLKESVPVTYPHLLAFPLHMSLMTDGAFPFPAIGTVHVGNRITQHRAITADETLDVLVRADSLRPHAKGSQFDLVTEVRAGGELVWEETSTMLRRGRPPENSAAEPSWEVVPSSGTEWSLPGDLGREYGAVSGDRNPIHLYALTAKAFGFPRQIAHGMWTKARCLAALDSRLPDALTVDVAFKKPVLLPGRVAFGSKPDPTNGATEAADASAGADASEGYLFSVTNPKTGAPHLVGRAVTK